MFLCARRNVCDATCFIDDVGWSECRGLGRAGSVRWIQCCGSERTAVHRYSKVSPLACMSSVSICASLFLVLHCSEPADITHGSHSGPAKVFFTPGTSVSYMCEPGFSLIGAATIYCTQSGAWSHPPPVCQGVFLLQRAKKGHLTWLALGKGLYKD